MVKSVKKDEKFENVHKEKEDTYGNPEAKGKNICRSVIMVAVHMHALVASVPAT